MYTVTLDAMVDEIVAALAERRRQERAYIALARAILADEPCEREQLAESNAA